MTNPTDEEVEAAAREIDSSCWVEPDDLTPTEQYLWRTRQPLRQAAARDRGRRALTAAAQVRERAQQRPEVEELRRSLLAQGNVYGCGRATEPDQGEDMLGIDPPDIPLADVLGMRKGEE